MWPRIVLGLLSVACLSGAAGCGTPRAAEPDTRAMAARCTVGRSFVLVRHAEKASSDKDTPLSERGQARAKDIASLLVDAGVTRLIASQFRRTQETLAPLAERLSLRVEVRPADKTSDLVRELRASPDGSMTVLATHSNVLPMVVRELVGRGTKLRGVDGDALAEDDYSRVVVITESCGATTPSVVELRSDDR